MAKFAKLECFPMKDTFTLSMLWNKATLLDLSASDIMCEYWFVYSLWPRFHLISGNGK